MTTTTAAAAAAAAVNRHESRTQGKRTDKKERMKRWNEEGRGRSEALRWRQEENGFRVECHCFDTSTC